MKDDIQVIVNSVIEQATHDEQAVLDEGSILRVKHAVFEMVDLELQIVIRDNKDTADTLLRGHLPYLAAMAVEILMRRLLEE